MRPTLLRLLLGALSLGVVTTVFLWETERTLAAPLSAVHGELPELSSSESCSSCHGEGGDDMAAACFECHEEVSAQTSGGQGFHAALEEVESCGRCHTEHAGRDFALVREESFRSAGFETRDAYDHAGLDYELGGVHLELGCVECHELADAPRLREGERRFQGLSQECESCHESEHEGEMQRACVECHGEHRPFEEHAEFSHTEAFALEQAHDLEDCRECHAKRSANSVEANASSGQEPAVRECAACHEHNHSEGFLEAAASDCLDCHVLSHADFAAAAERVDADRHAFSGFALAAPHDTQECADCHKGEDFALRYPGRLRTDCVACHEDPHEEQFVGEGMQLACADCHFEQRFVPARFDALEHAECGFPLEGSHAAVGCFECHEQPESGPLSARTWRGLDESCASCHEDPHDGQFDDRSPAQRSRGEDATGCARCHEPEGFAKAREDFDHDNWAGFELAGAHAEAQCEACHEPSARDALGRSFGRIADHYGSPPTAEKPCATCHTDPHEARFDGVAHRDGDPIGEGCARCHGSSTFAELLAQDFEHERWTGVALLGAHLELECDACHQPSRAADEHGRSFGRVVDSFPGDVERCVTCHADPHDGVFDRPPAPQVSEGRVGCARCHAESSFSEVDLEAYFHDLWTGTDLRSRHGEEVGCDDCHPPLSEPGWRGRGRLPAKGRSCVDCHADDHSGQFGLEDRDRCARCHVPGTTFEEQVFDHQRDSVFALDEHHIGLECDACHREYERPDGSLLVRYKPLGLLCVDCHGVPDSPGEGSR